MKLSILLKNRMNLLTGEDNWHLIQSLTVQEEGQTHCEVTHRITEEEFLILKLQKCATSALSDSLTANSEMVKEVEREGKCGRQVIPRKAVWQVWEALYGVTYISYTINHA